MIVISGALVVLALVFLLVGLAMKGLVLVYVSIGVSVLSAVFLLLGVFSKKDELTGEDAEQAASPVEGVTVVGGEAPATTTTRDAGDTGDTGEVDDAQETRELAAVGARTARRSPRRSSALLAGRDTQAADDAGAPTAGDPEPDEVVVLTNPATSPAAEVPDDAPPPRPTRARAPRASAPVATFLTRVVIKASCGPGSPSESGRPGVKGHDRCFRFPG